MTIKYTSDHLWINLDGPAATVVGITPHAQESLGDVVFVELPALGSVFKRGDAVGVIESVKAASDLLMPVAGEIVAINEALRDDPSLANSDPLGDGWLFKMTWAETAELAHLLDQAAYDALVKNE